MTDSIKRIRQLILTLTRHPLYTKYGLFIIPGVSVLTAILISLLVTLPQIFKLIENNNQLNEIKQTITARQAKIAALEQVDLDEYKNNLDNVLYTLPSDKEIASAMNSVLELLSASALRMDNFTLGNNLPTSSGAEAYVVSLEVSGTIGQVKDLITISSAAPRLIKINGIDLTSSSGGNVQIGLDVLVFYSPLNALKTSPDTKITLLTDDEKKLLTQIEERIKPLKNSPSETTSVESPSGKDDPFN